MNKIGDDLEPGPDYQKAKAKLTAMPDEPGKAVLELFAQLEEAKNALKAMTEHAAELTIENMRQSRRITELLESNNAFEQRARNAERKAIELNARIANALI